MMSELVAGSAWICPPVDGGAVGVTLAVAGAFVVATAALLIGGMRLDMGAQTVLRYVVAMLGIVRVEAADGRIWFETRTGEGTVFFLDFPLMKSDTEPPAPPSGA